MKHLLLTLSASLFLSACGAGRSYYYLWEAEREIVVARELEASQKAIYEFTLAHEFLMKAREEHGYADYHFAEKMARKSAEWSAKAAAVAEYGTSERELMLQEIGQEVPDAASTIEEDRLVPLTEGSED